MKKLIHWLRQPRHRLLKITAVTLIFLAAAALFYTAYQAASYLQYKTDPRNQPILEWAISDPDTQATLITVQREACLGAPFVLPADGFIGLLYEDPRGPYSTRKPHQGIDIFSGTEPGITAVYAAYDGYVTRQSDWTSTLIMRVPQDPLAPDEQIWLYYTHMADRAGNDFIDPAFPRGTSERFVKQGTLLGYTGDYNGSSPRTVWVHVHFSIVMDDGNGRYLNELNFNNSKDPSPYFGMNLNYTTADESDFSASATCR